MGTAEINFPRAVEACRITNRDIMKISEENWEQHRKSPNVGVEYLASQLRIWEITGSNLGTETGCPS
jgi:hypothetical protein